MVQKKDDELVYSGVLQPHEHFSFVGTYNGTLGTEITIYVNGSENTRIHTSCSDPIGPGLVSGDFLVVDGASRNGGPLCPVEGGGGGQCSVIGAQLLDIHNRELKWELTNTGGDTVTIERITLTWPSANGELKKVKLDKKTIFDQRRAPTVTTIDSDWKATSKTES